MTGQKRVTINCFREKSILIKIACLGSNKGSYNITKLVNVTLSNMSANVDMLECDRGQLFLLSKSLTFS